MCVCGGISTLLCQHCSAELNDRFKGEDIWEQLWLECERVKSAINLSLCGERLACVCWLSLLAKIWVRKWRRGSTVVAERKVMRPGSRVIQLKTTKAAATPRNMLDKAAQRQTEKTLSRVTKLFKELKALEEGMGTEIHYFNGADRNTSTPPHTEMSCYSALTKLDFLLKSKLIGLIWTSWISHCYLFWETEFSYLRGPTWDVSVKQELSFKVSLESSNTPNKPTDSNGLITRNINVLNDQSSSVRKLHWALTYWLSFSGRVTESTTVFISLQQQNVITFSFLIAAAARADQVKPRPNVYSCQNHL